MVVLPAENYTFGLPVQTFEYKRDAEFRTADLHADVHLPPASVKRPASGWPVRASAPALALAKYFADVLVFLLRPLKCSSFMEEVRACSLQPTFG